MYTFGVNASDNEIIFLDGDEVTHVVTHVVTNEFDAQLGERIE